MPAAMPRQTAPATPAGAPIVAVASSSRSQRAMWSATTLTMSDLPALSKDVRWRLWRLLLSWLLTCRGPVAVITGLIPYATDRPGDA